MEPLDLAVGLGPVGPGAAMFDVEVAAGFPPDVAAVAGSVVGEPLFDDDAAGEEPDPRPAQDRRSRFFAFVVVDLGVDDPAVVIEDAVHERVTDPRLAVLVAMNAWG